VRQKNKPKAIMRSSKITWMGFGSMRMSITSMKPKTQTLNSRAILFSWSFSNFYDNLGTKNFS
jgi:hypothetical protein